MKTFEDLKALVQRYDKACNDWVDDRYSPILEWGGGFDAINTNVWSEGWKINLQDEFFYFEVKGETFEETINKAYDVLEGYVNQVESRNITATYLLGNKYRSERTLHPFSIKECRKWNNYGEYRECFPTKEAALEQLEREKRKA